MIQMTIIKDNFEFGDEVYVEIKTIFGNCYTRAKIIYIYKTLSGIFKKLCKLFKKTEKKSSKIQKKVLPKARVYVYNLFGILCAGSKKSLKGGKADGKGEKEKST